MQPSFGYVKGWKIGWLKMQPLEHRKDNSLRSYMYSCYPFPTVQHCFCFRPMSFIQKLLFFEMYRCRSRSGSNQPEPVSTEIPLAGEQTAAPVNKNGKGKKKQIAKKIPIYPMAPLDSPAMSTRSKKTDPASPAMGTRSKRGLSLWFSPKTYDMYACRLDVMFEHICTRTLRV